MAEGRTLVLRHVGFRYAAAATESLADVSLAVKPGEVVCLTGGSGSGKTTLARVANGLVPHYYEGELVGRARVAGLDPASSELWELAPHVGSVFQNPKTQFFCLDTTGELAFGCENLGVAPERIRGRMDEVAAALQLGALLGRDCLALSGGERQRVACGAAAMTRPELLVLDEPSSNLDYASMRRLRDIVARWKEAGRAVLVAEHRLLWLGGLADRLVVMRGGAVAEELDGRRFFSSDVGAARARGLRAPSLASIAAEPCRVAPEGDDFLHVEGLRWHFPRSSKGVDVPALDLRRGGVTAVIGPNGAGKSTLARCLCGLARGCAGTVRAGRDSWRLSTRTHHGFLVMQDVSHQLFRDSVLGEVLASMPVPDDGDARALLASLDLAGLAERHPLSLSGGEAQRVAVATALASGRELLVLDEPTSGLDLAHMAQVAEAVHRAAAVGRSVVVVTHDPEFVQTCCTDFVRMEDGRVADAGPLDEAGWARVTAFFAGAFGEADGRA